jgi:hypothetical protein
MDDSVLTHVIDRLKKAQIHTDPYPHFFVPDIFPEEFYQEILNHLLDVSLLQNWPKIQNNAPDQYQQRWLLGLNDENLSRLPFSHCIFWKNIRDALGSDLWKKELTHHFDPYLKKRFGDTYAKDQFCSSMELVHDKTNYAIGPHTDHPAKVITLLFYLPKSTDLAHLGTSVYRPRDPTFTCEGLAHYPRDQFEKLSTAPFVPNSLFGFVKTNNSFHGVEPIQDTGIERNLMNFFLQLKHP